MFLTFHVWGPRVRRGVGANESSIETDDEINGKMMIGWRWKVKLKMRCLGDQSS